MERKPSKLEQSIKDVPTNLTQPLTYFSTFFTGILGTVAYAWLADKDANESRYVLGIFISGTASAAAGYLFGRTVKYLLNKKSRQ